MSVCGQFIDPDTKELVVRDFSFVADLADQRIKEIESEVWATEPSTLYFTGDYALTRSKNKQLKREGLPEKAHVPNFRFEVAKKVEYKGTRKTPKPFHFHNLREYLMANYDHKVAEGIEADDLLCIDLMSNGDKLSVVCCSRDKDLRMVPGMHYGWSVGKQQSYGPKRVGLIGEIELLGGKKLVGNGLKFFYSQTIMGDATDSIPGLPKGGPVKAYNLLNDCTTEEEMFATVLNAYTESYGEDARKEFMEQATLLWMLREVDDEGVPIKYVLPDEREVA